VNSLIVYVGILLNSSIESLKKFADDVLTGKLEPYLKSEPIPDKNDEPVKVEAKFLF